MSCRILTLFISLFATTSVSAVTSDLLIVGCGVSGLAAAAEGARLGLKVTMVDRNSLYGGAGVNAYGVAIVDSPLQRQQGIHDSAEIALRDFVRWGGDPDLDWVRYYTEHSNEELYDWFTSRGVEFGEIAQPNGNSVPRFHFPIGGVVAMVQALYREIDNLGGVEFVMNTNVSGLVVEDGRVIGVKVQEYRTGHTRTLLARNVLLSTGGFQTSPELVREFWPSQHGNPERILLGGGMNATGSGLDLAQSVGGEVAQLDRQWNYFPGIPRPDDPTGNRGVYVNIRGPMWVNAQALRFAYEAGDKRSNFTTLTEQVPAKAWMIFDASFRPKIEITRPIFAREPTKSNLLSQPGILFEAATIEELGEKAGLPSAVLANSVARFNAGLASGEDEFNPQPPGEYTKRSSLRPILIPPFYALPVYPLTRKSMGGIQIDLECRVMAESGKTVPGLYASGEATGFGGINGKQSLEGTFIGSAILMGRVVSRSIAAPVSYLAIPDVDQVVSEILRSRDELPAMAVTCVTCHDLPRLTTDPRPGYRHFQASHRVVLERQLSCTDCHSEMSPFRSESHKINKLVQVESCNTCHSPLPR